MDALAPLLVIALLGLVVWIVGAPLLRGRAEEADERERREGDGLQAAKEAKYREIRELELDHRTGKVEDDDFRDQDRALRGEAVEILRRLDALVSDAPEAAGEPARR